MTEQIISHYATVHGTRETSGPFGGPPSFLIQDPDTDVEIDPETGTLQIVVAPRATARGVTVERSIRYPRGSYSSVSVSRTTMEA